MNNEEKNIESLLKKEIETIDAPRAVFDRVMHTVTQSTVHRNTEVKALVLSPYQSFSFFMKKISMIGVPALVLLIIVGVQMNKQTPQNDGVVRIDTTQPVELPTQAEETALLASGSIDAIVDSFVTEGTYEANLTATESDDVTVVEDELSAFTRIETAYENTF